MARIQTPQTVQDVQAEFKVRGRMDLELLETIQPTYIIGSDKVASTGYPRKAFGVNQAAAGGVGTNIENIITCPAGRGIVIMLEQIWIENVGGRVTFRMTDGVAPATVSGEVSTKAWRDGRLSGGIPDAVLETANPLTAAPNGILVGQVSCLTDDTQIFDFNIVLGGGAYFLVRDSTANNGNNTTFIWTEYLLEDR